MVSDLADTAEFSPCRNLHKPVQPRTRLWVHHCGNYAVPCKTSNTLALSVGTSK